MVKKLLNNSIFFFIVFTLIVIIISKIGYLLGWQAVYMRINPITGNLESVVVSIENLLTTEGLRYIIGNALANFVTFAPLGMIILSLLGIGVAYKSDYYQLFLLF